MKNNFIEKLKNCKTNKELLKQILFIFAKDEWKYELNKKIDEVIKQ